MFERWFIVYILFTIISSPLIAQETNDIKYTFSQNDSSYTFSGSFITTADKQCLLTIFFEHKHIKALAPDAKEVILMDEGNDWNKISYTYQKYLYFVNKSLWNRELDQESHRVNFELVSSENNRSIVPEMLESSGYYRLIQENGNTKVEYCQYCVLSNSSLTNIYLNSAKRQAVEFLNRLKEYVNQNCIKN